MSSLFLFLPFLCLGLLCFISSGLSSSSLSIVFLLFNFSEFINKLINPVNLNGKFIAVAVDCVELVLEASHSDREAGQLICDGAESLVEG